MSKTFAPALFSVPQAPARTTVKPEEAETFLRAERRTGDEATEAVAMSRLSVDVPAAALRKLKIHAIERGMTVREVVLNWLEREGWG